MPARARPVSISSRRSPRPSPLVIAPRSWAAIPTGLVFEIPRGYQGEVRPRSGLALRHAVTVLNAPGTIDSDYRGEVRVLLVNLGPEAFTVTRGMRVAQLVVRAGYAGDADAGQIAQHDRAR